MTDRSHEDERPEWATVMRWADQQRILGVLPAAPPDPILVGEPDRLGKMAD